MGVPRIDDRDGVRWITLDRPAQLNALERDDLAALVDAIQRAPDAVGALVLTGAGERAFSSGVHVDIFDGLDVAGARSFITELGAVMTALRRANVPSVCAIRGYCLGGAMEIAMACDLRVAADDAVFGMPEIAVGIPSVLDAALLPGYVGPSLAREVLLTGELYPVGRFTGTGLLNAVVPAAELTAAAADLAGRIAGHARPAVAAQKRLFETWQEVGLSAAVGASIGEFAETFGHPATAARIAGYRAERRP